MDLILRKLYFRFGENRIGGAMVSMPTSSVIDRGFKPQSGQTKDYKTGICCLSAEQAALRRKNKDWLAQNQDNVTEWGDISIHPQTVVSVN